MWTDNSKRLVVTAQTPPAVTGKDITTAAKTIPDATGQDGIEQFGATDPRQSGPVHMMENDDPLRRRIFNPGRHSWIKKFIRWVDSLINKQKYITPEERAAIKENEARKLLEKVLLQESRYVESRIQNGLAGLGLCHRGKNDKITKVRFDLVKAEPNAIWLRVNTRRLPMGVSCDALVTQEAIDHLGYVCGHAVTARTDFENGIWYVVERASGRMGIPNHVKITDMWESMPASQDALAIPMGLTNNRRPIYISLNEMVHCLVAGTTGSGKSNMLNLMINTIIRRNRPDRVQIGLIDLKGGLEFNRYRNIPHLMKLPGIAPDGIVNEREQVESYLQYIVNEGERRMRLLDGAGCSNIATYNVGRRKHALSMIVVFIDEWGDVRMAGKPAEIEKKLVNVVQRMRAVGIHIILATQIPKSEVIGTLVVGNMPCKIAFGMPNITASKTVLGNGHAFGISPVGRCIIQMTGERECQTPFIPQSVMEETIRGAATGEYGAVLTSHDVSAEEIFAWAINENNGWCSVRDVFEQFSNARGITRVEIEEILKEAEESEALIVGNSTYRMTPHAGNRGRRLVALDVAGNEGDTND